MQNIHFSKGLIPLAIAIWDRKFADSNSVTEEQTQKARAFFTNALDRQENALHIQKFFEGQTGKSVDEMRLYQLVVSYQELVISSGVSEEVFERQVLSKRIPHYPLALVAAYKILTRNQQIKNIDRKMNEVARFWRKLNESGYGDKERSFPDIYLPLMALLKSRGVRDDYMLDVIGILNLPTRERPVSLGAGDQVPSNESHPTFDFSVHCKFPEDSLRKASDYEALAQFLGYDMTNDRAVGGIVASVERLTRRAKAIKLSAWERRCLGQRLTLYLLLGVNEGFLENLLDSDEVRLPASLVYCRFIEDLFLICLALSELDAGTTALFTLRIAISRFTDCDNLQSLLRTLTRHLEAYEELQERERAVKTILEIGKISGGDPYFEQKVLDCVKDLRIKSIIEGEEVAEDDMFRSVRLNSIARRVDEAIEAVECAKAGIGRRVDAESGERGPSNCISFTMSLLGRVFCPCKDTTSLENLESIEMPQSSREPTQR